MITDKKMDKNGMAARHVLNVPITTAINQSGLLVYGFTPGIQGKIEKVTVFASSVTATITVDVQVSGTTALTGQITPVAGTETAGTLVSNIDTLIVTPSEQIQVKYTSNGTGAATNLVVSIVLRAYPTNQDAAL